MVYEIWLFKNGLVFEFEIVPIYRVLERAYSLAKEHSRFDCTDITGRLSINLSFRDSLAAPTATRRIFFNSWEPPSLGFIKVNFVCSVRDARGGMGYVIQDLDGRLLAIEGSLLFELSVSGAKLHAALIA